MEFANRQDLIKKVIGREQLEYIDAFCMQSSRMERIEILAAMRKELSGLVKEVNEAGKSHKICAHLKGQMNELIKEYRDSMKSFTETQKTMPCNTKEIMINYRLVKALIENTLSEGNVCDEGAVVC